MDKKQAWLGLAVLAAIQAALLYLGYNGQIQTVVIPLVTYFFGIATKTAVDKTILNK